MKTSGQEADGPGNETRASGIYRRITESIRELDFIIRMG